MFPDAIGFLRFIPTAVGNAELKVLILGAFEVHPHGCGERK